MAQETDAGVPAMMERLLDDLDVLAETSPDAVALIDARADTMRRTTWYELQVRYRALAADLRQRGVVAGGAVAVWLPNWSDAIVWQLGRDQRKQVQDQRPPPSRAA
jgi:acyl-CoA synthetase (AMP-forming)/AMP-acid ligase II